MMPLVTYVWQRLRRRRIALPSAAPAVRSISAVFGHSVLIGMSPA
jgi:hypothetical protein